VDPLGFDDVLARARDRVSERQRVAAERVATSVEASSSTYVARWPGRMRRALASTPPPACDAGQVRALWDGERVVDVLTVVRAEDLDRAEPAYAEQAEEWVERLRGAVRYHDRWAVESALARPLAPPETEYVVVATSYRMPRMEVGTGGFATPGALGIVEGPGFAPGSLSGRFHVVAGDRTVCATDVAAVSSETVTHWSFGGPSSYAADQRRVTRDLLKNVVRAAYDRWSSP